MVICKVFREAQYIEKLGSGLISAFDSYAEKGLPNPEVINGENFVKCILPRKSMVSAHADDLEPILRLFISADMLAISDIMKATRLPRTTLARKLNKLVSMGQLEVTGTGKGTRYKKI